MNRPLLALVSIIVIAAPAWAAVQTVTLAVPTMDCPVCPLTVKKALTGVAGVSKAEIDFDKRQAKVTFDDTRTSVEALIKATTHAGYPSTLARQP